MRISRTNALVWFLIAALNLPVIAQTKDTYRPTIRVTRAIVERNLWGNQRGHGAAQMRGR